MSSAWTPARPATANGSAPGTSTYLPPASVQRRWRDNLRIWWREIDKVLEESAAEPADMACSSRTRCAGA